MQVNCHAAQQLTDVYDIFETALMMMNIEMFIVIEHARLQSNHLKQTWKIWRCAHTDSAFCAFCACAERSVLSWIVRIWVNRNVVGPFFVVVVRGKFVWLYECAVCVCDTKIIRQTAYAFMTRYRRRIPHCGRFIQYTNHSRHSHSQTRTYIRLRTISEGQTVRCAWQTNAL